MTEASGGAEVQQPTAVLPLEDQRRIAQRAVGDREGKPAHNVVDDLVPDQDLVGIGGCPTALLHDEHGLIVFEPAVCILDRNEPWSVDRRDAVLGWAPGHDLFQRDRVTRKVGRPARALLLLGWALGLLSRARVRVTRHGRHSDQQNEVSAGWSTANQAHQESR